MSNRGAAHAATVPPSAKVYPLCYASAQYSASSANAPMRMHNAIRRGCHLSQTLSLSLYATLALSVADSVSVKCALCR